MPDWPLPDGRAAEIARHYGDELSWFASDLEQDDDARMQIRGACRDFLSIAKWLDALDLNEGPLPVVEWLRKHQRDEDDNWRSAVAWAETCLNSKVWNLIEVTDHATSEEPLYGEPDVAERERPFWPEGATPARPSVDPLFRDGLMTQDWIDCLQALADGFQSLADEMCNAHDEVTAARSLLFRGFFLCMDVVYAGRALDYAWHLHATDEDRPDWTEEDLLRLLRETKDSLRAVVRFLDRDKRTSHLWGDPYFRGGGIGAGGGIAVRQSDGGEWTVFAGPVQIYAIDAQQAEHLGTTPRELAEEFAEDLRQAARRYSEDEPEDSDADGE